MTPPRRCPAIEPRIRALETHTECLRRAVIGDHDDYRLHRPVALRTDPLRVRLRVLVGAAFPGSES